LVSKDFYHTFELSKKQKMSKLSIQNAVRAGHNIRKLGIDCVREDDIVYLKDGLNEEQLQVIENIKIITKAKIQLALPL
jgi:molybdopterin biosynthesis enzyme